jgi:hypothetical protein
VRIDLASFKTIDEIFDRQIDIDNLVGPFQDRIGNRFPNNDSSRLLHQLIEAFEMLDIERTDDIDTHVQQFQRVLVALLISAKRRIGVRQLIDHGDLRPSLQNGIQIHLFHHQVPVLDLFARNDLEPLDQRFCLSAAVGFDEAQHDVHASLFQSMGFFQHLKSLSNPCRRADIHFQTTAVGALDQLEEIFGALAFCHRYKDTI